MRRGVSPVSGFMKERDSVADRAAMTPSLEDYLKVIYGLHEADRVVRSIDVAEGLSVTKPSANRAIAQLRDMGLVEHEPYGPVLLTATGIDMAERIVARHDVIKRFLVGMLNIDEDFAASEACRIEHGISATTVERMAVLV